MIAAVSDTHPLLWYASGKSSKLGRKARRVFESAERADGDGLVYIPTVVLAEAVFLVQSGFVSITPPFNEWVRNLSHNRFFQILDLTTEVILRAYSMPAIANPFDRLIAATAVEHGYPLITLDDKITRSRLVECLWDE